MTPLSSCTFDRWSPAIGDPGVMGWLTVIVYALAGLLSLVVANRIPPERDGSGREWTFWSIAGFLLLILAVNKQLDLQSLFTAVGRCVAQAQGWYEDRAVVQRRFILGLMVASMLLVGVMVWLLRGTLRHTGLALLALAFVLTFVAIRAAGFHHVDLLINTRIAGFRMNWLLELPGPLLFLACAGRELRRSSG